MISIKKILPLKTQFKSVSGNDLVKRILQQKMPRMKDKEVFK